MKVNNTDLNSGLEYLPTNLEDFECFSVEIAESKVKEIEQKLRKYGKMNDDNFINLLKSWKEDNQELILKHYWIENISNK